jgi:hypothetical protein
MRKGGKYEIPTKIEVHGKIRYYIIIEGTPTIGNESYYCNLWMKVPLIEDNITQDIRIQNGTPTKCIVDPLQAIHDIGNEQPFKIYPNPAEDKLIIKATKDLLQSNYVIFNSLGENIVTGQVSDEFTTVNIQALPVGVYFIQVGQQAKHTLQIIKK